MTFSLPSLQRNLLAVGCLFYAGLALQDVVAQGEKDLPPDASHLPDIETDEEPKPSPPEILDLPSWGDDEAKLVPRLWPGNKGSPSKPATTFVPEIQLPPEVDPTAIPDLHLSDYFGTLPETYLVDPQTLLTAHERTAINQALRDHFKEYDLPIYILLFDDVQRIPEFQSLEGVRERWFGDRPGILIGFWLGAPTRTTALFGATLRKEYGNKLDDSFAEALGQSYKKTYPFSQLDHFSYTLLWRLSHLDEVETSSPPSSLAAQPLPNVPDFDPADTTTNWIAMAAGPSALALGIAALGIGIIASRRKRERLKNQLVTTVLTDDQRAERLGAPHSGGSGAAINVEPAEITEIPS